jgi:hypothetical protein
MKNLLLILLFLPSSTSFGQVLDYDGNDDGCVNIDDALGLLMEFGQCLDVEVFVCGETIEHQDYDYSTVQIGEQCWFSENRL